MEMRCRRGARSCTSGAPTRPAGSGRECSAKRGCGRRENRGKLALFAGIDDCRFKRVVEPGDVLELRCELQRMRGPIGRGKAEARVEGELACRATLTFAVER